MPKVWLFSKRLDLLLLYFPVLCTWLICFSLSSDVLDQPLPLWAWVVFILGIDVSHVWSTILRTYRDPEAYHLNKKLLHLTPTICFIVLFGICFWMTSYFWTAMAYLAVFHFIKQQYGFMMIYKAKGKEFRKKFMTDKFVIYLSMLYPVLYWHLSGDRVFSWFAELDFFIVDNTNTTLLSSLYLCNWIYWSIILVWLTEEIHQSVTHKNTFQTGKVLWILCTAINWYLGIVYFNSDIAFSITNVVAHGIPYMALIFFYVHRRKQIEQPDRSIPVRKIITTTLWLLCIVLLFAFFEEYLWDLLINRDKAPFFESILPYPNVTVIDTDWIQSLVIALLSLPQVTHYVLDGYIWKMNHRNPHLKKILF